MFYLKNEAVVTNEDNFCLLC